MEFLVALSSAPAQAVRLGQVLTARLCHDLAGPLGTLNAALGMAEGPDAAEARALAEESAGVMMARLRLLRAAWGGCPDPLEAAELRALALGLPGSGRISVSLDGVDPALEEPAGQIALCLMLTGAECLPRGGVVAVGWDGDVVSVRLDGPRVLPWPQGLAGGGDAASAREFAGPWAGLIAASVGWVIRVDGVSACAASM